MTFSRSKIPKWFFIYICSYCNWVLFHNILFFSNAYLFLHLFLCKFLNIFTSKFLLDCFIKLILSVVNSGSGYFIGCFSLQQLSSMYWILLWEILCPHRSLIFASRFLSRLPHLGSRNSQSRQRRGALFPDVKAVCLSCYLLRPAAAYVALQPQDESWEREGLWWGSLPHLSCLPTLCLLIPFQTILLHSTQPCLCHLWL